MNNQKALSWLVFLGMAGCTVHSPLASNTSTLLLRVSLQNGRSTQTVVSPKTIADIQRIEIIPYQEVSTGSYAPISRINACTTTLEDPNLLKVIRNAPLDLAGTLEVRGLKPHTRYRIYGQAYDAQNNLISTQDSTSYLEVAIADDDCPTIGTLPVKLADSLFDAQLQLNVDVDTPFYSAVDVSLLCLSATPTYSVASPTSPNLGYSRYSFTFSNLRANSNYQIEAHASGASTVQGFSVSNDNVLPSISLILAPMANVESLAGGVFNTPTEVAAANDGRVYVADPEGSRVYKVEGGGAIPFVGTGMYGFSTEYMPADQTDIARPTGVAVSNFGNVYVVDRDNYMIYKINPDRTLQILAGCGGVDYMDGSGPAYEGLLNWPTCIAVDANENVFFTEQDPPRIRKIDNSGTLSTITSTGFVTPGSLTVEPSGALLVVDMGDNRVKRVDKGMVSTVAGNGVNASSGDGGSPLDASLAGPNGVAMDPRGNIFISEANTGRVRCISPSGRIHTVAVGLNNPGGLASDGQGNVYVVDTGTHCLKRLR